MTTPRPDETGTSQNSSYRDTRSRSLQRMVRPLRVVMFQPRFAELVESGAKCQTVRPPRKKALKAGDALSLRAWTGKPYRSKQRVLRESEVNRVANIYICEGGAVELDGAWLSRSSEDAFARADGFASGEEMVAWFRNTHGLPFEGRVIYWPNAGGSADPGLSPD